MADETVNQGIPAPEGHSDIIDTEYEIGQDNIQTHIGPFGLDIHNPVFLISGTSIIALRLLRDGSARAGRGDLRLAAPWRHLDLRRGSS